MHAPLFLFHLAFSDRSIPFFPHEKYIDTHLNDCSTQTLPYMQMSMDIYANVEGLLAAKILLLAALGTR